MRKIVAKTVFIYMVSILVGTMALCVVYCIPTERMREHLQQDVEMLYKEGNYTDFCGQLFVRMHGYNIDFRTMLLNNRGMARDNYTDALMLNHAIYKDNEESILRQALEIQRPDFDKDQPIRNLELYLKSTSASQTKNYPRYWHGYLVVLKPLLFFFSYKQIRLLNLVFLSALFLSVVYQYGKRTSKQHTIGLVLSVLCIFPFSIPFCMQYCTVTYITLIMVQLYLKKYDWVIDGNHSLYFFFITGCMTSYVDFLTFPIMSLGILLLVAMTLDKFGTISIIGKTMMWGIGYFSMWAGKWCIATLILKENVIMDGIRQTAFRLNGASNTSLQEELSSMKAIFANLSSMTNIYYITCFLIILIFCIGCWRRNDKGNIRELFVTNRAYLLVALYPIAWFMILKNHSYDHSSFTYRAFIVTIYALVLFVIERGKKNDRFNSNYTDKK